MPVARNGQLSPKHAVYLRECESRLCLISNVRAEIIRMFSLKGRACILPYIPRDLVLLPAASTEWIINQLDGVLDVKQVHLEALQTDYTFSDLAIAREPHHEDIVRTDLLKQLGNLTKDIMDELAIGFDETWGLDTKEWKGIGIYDGHHCSNV